MEVPLKLIETVAPAVLACFAVPPLQPLLASALAHVPVKLTALSDSSTRVPGPGSATGGGVGPPPPPGPGELTTTGSPPPPPPHETRTTARRMRRKRGM
jgi:hypothetical protein